MITIKVGIIVIFSGENILTCLPLPFNNKYNNSLLHIYGLCTYFAFYLFEV